MTIVLKRLERRLEKESTKQSFTLPKDNSGALNWSIFRQKNKGTQPADDNHKAITAFHQILVKEDMNLVSEYIALCNLLILKLNAYNQVSSEQLKKDSIAIVEELHELTVQLEEKYCHLLNQGALTKARLETDRARYEHWLKTHADITKEPIILSLPPKKNNWITELILWLTIWTNPARLFLARDWRFLRQVDPFIHDKNFSEWMLSANVPVSLALTYLGCIFFIPRLIFNTLTIMKHVVPGFWMDEAEKDLGWWTRFNAQWMRLWPNMTNDTAWITNGALLTFYLVGQLFPNVIFLTVIVLLYDLIMAGSRWWLDRHRYEQLINDHQLNDTDPLKDEYLTQLQNTLDREKKLLNIALANFGLLFLGMCLVLPWLVTLSPLLPLISASMAVAITLFNFGSRQYLLKQPSMDLKAWHDLLPLPKPDNAPETATAKLSEDSEVAVPSTANTEISNQKQPFRNQSFLDTFTHTLSAMFRSNDSPTSVAYEGTKKKLVEERSIEPSTEESLTDDFNDKGYNLEF